MWSFKLKKARYWKQSVITAEEEHYNGPFNWFLLNMKKNPTSFIESGLSKRGMWIFKITEIQITCITKSDKWLRCTPGFQVMGMIELGQNSNPKKFSRGFQQNPKKIPGLKINPRKIPCRISEP